MRRQFKELGFIIEDKPEETRWKRRTQITTNLTEVARVGLLICLIMKILCLNKEKSGHLDKSEESK